MRGRGWSRRYPHGASSGGAAHSTVSVLTILRGNVIQERDQDLLLEWLLRQPFDCHQLLERKELGPHTEVGRVLWCGVGGKGHVERREKGLSPAAAPPPAPQLPAPTEAMPSPPFSRGSCLRCDEGDISRMNGAPHAAATDKLTHWKTSKPAFHSNPGRPSCPCTCVAPSSLL